MNTFVELLLFTLENKRGSFETTKNFDSLKVKYNFVWWFVCVVGCLTQFKLN